MKFTLAVLLAAAASAVALEPRQQASTQDVLNSLGPCKDACSVLQTVSADAAKAGCDAQNPSQECLKTLCGCQYHHCGPVSPALGALASYAIPGSSALRNPYPPATLPIARLPLACANDQHLDDSLNCAECSIRNGPFADKFTDADIQRGKQDSRNFCAKQG